jgi:hypothetical protein
LEGVSSSCRQGVSFSCRPTVNDLDFNGKKNKASGYCTWSDPGGDQAYSTWQCEGDTQTCRGTDQFTGGTGKYQGMNVRHTFVGHIQVNWQDGTSSGYSTINR